MRSLAELDQIEVGKWTPEEAHAHLAATFAAACAEHPDIMERHEILLGDADSQAAEIAIMRRGLRETIRARYPLYVAPHREAAE